MLAWADLSEGRARTSPTWNGSTVPTKVGSIVSWGRSGRQFVEANLHTGERVELPLAMRVQVDRYRDGFPLVFVERRGRLFRYVHWLGTPEEALGALRSGILRPEEITTDVRVNAGMLDWIAEEQQLRASEALQLIQDVLPTTSRTSLAAFRFLIESLLLLGDRDIQRVRDDHEAWLSTGTLTVMSAISQDALRVGYAVRWVRWPNPRDPTRNSDWRAGMDPAASAVEWAVASLAEPTLSEADVIATYAPLETAIPRATVRLAGPCA